MSEHHTIQWQSWQTLLLYCLAYCFQGVCSGVLVGCGKQHLGAIVNLVGYYFLALPLAILLSVSGWDLSGMWNIFM